MNELIEKHMKDKEIIIKSLSNCDNGCELLIQKVAEIILTRDNIEQIQKNKDNTNNSQWVPPSQTYILFRDSIYHAWNKSINAGKPMVGSVYIFSFFFFFSVFWFVVIV